MHCLPRLIWFLLLVGVGFVLPLKAQTGSDSLAVPAPGPADSLSAGERSRGDTTASDTSAAADSLGAADSLAAQGPAPAVRRRGDTVRLDREGSLEAPVKYNAQDSIVLDLTAEETHLFEKAKVTYQDMELESARIQVQYAKNLMAAQGKRDTAGELVQTPVFTEQGETYHARKMKYNFETRTGHITYARTRQGEDRIEGEQIRRNPDNTYYIKNARFTSCEIDTTGFYFRSKKVKVIPGDKLITGPTVMYIAHIPTPLVLPFAFFPQTEGRSAGILLPEYGQNEALGFFFQNFGYFQPVGEHLGLTFTGDISTKGQFAGRANVAYDWRYKASGNFNLEMARTPTGNPAASPGDPDFQATRTFRVGLNHQQTINPQMRLGANLDLSSSQHSRLTEQENRGRFLDNSRQSSIDLQYRPPNSAWNFTFAGNVNQDLGRETVSLTLPNINASRAPFFPFQRKQQAGRPKWYEQIQMNYSANLRNEVRNLPDSLLFQPEMTDQMRNGLRQQVDMSTNLSLFNYITITPALNVTEFTYLKEMQKDFVQREETITEMVIDTVNGMPDTSFVEQAVPNDTLIEERVPDFTSGRQFNATLSASTNLYGLWQPKWAKNNFTFRHTFRPNISYNYRPDFSKDFWGYYNEVPINRAGETQRFSRFEGGTFGGPSAGEQQSLNISFNNIFEGKYIPRDDSGRLQTDSASGKPDYKYLTFLDQLSASTRYNFAADSFNLANIRFAARTNLLNNKVNLNANATLDPYAYERSVNPETEQEVITRVDKLRISEDGSLGFLKRASVGLGTNLKSPDHEEPDFSKMSAAKRRAYLQYRDFYIPWTFNISYNLGFSRPNPFVAGELNHSLNFRGSFNFTPKWDIQFTSSFDVQNVGIGPTTVNVRRDLGCWEASFNLRPFGGDFFRGYTFRIAVKSPKLQDLQIEKQRVWQDNL